MLEPSNHEVGEGEAATVRSRINAMLGRPAASTRFPCPVPTSVTPENLAAVPRVPHVLFRKNDGFHYMLLLTRGVDAAPTAYMMSRSLRVYRVAVAGPPAAFAGTLLEGELLEATVALGSERERDGAPRKRKRRRARISEFRVFRTLFLWGTDVRGHPFVPRHLATARLIADISGDEVAGHAMDRPAWAATVASHAAAGRLVSNQARLRLVAKPLFLVSDFRREAEAPAPNTDGLVLVPNVPHAELRHYPELKAKHVHTVDLRFVGFFTAPNNVEIDAMYSNGCTFVNAFRHLLFGGHHVVFTIKRNRAMDNWMLTFCQAGVRGDPSTTGERVVRSAVAIMECHLVLKRLKPAEAKRANAQEAQRVRALERARMGKNLSTVEEPRKFTYELTCEVLRERPDKTLPNTLTTLVSTIVQSSVLSMGKVAAMLEGAAVKAAPPCVGAPEGADGAPTPPS